MLAEQAIIPEEDTSESVGVEYEIDRPTEELVVGMVGAVGAGVSKTAQVLKDRLEGEYGYEVTIRKVSDLIGKNAAKAKLPLPAESGSERIIDLQKIGTSLRKRFKDDYLAAKAIDAIAVRRKRSGGYDVSKQVPQPKRLRHATIIDSLKHPKETELLRRVYGGMYWQFTSNSR